MDQLRAYLENSISQVVGTFQNPSATASDIFYAIHFAAFLPGCPTCPEAVKEAGTKMILELINRCAKLPSRESIRGSPPPTIITTGPSTGQEASLFLNIPLIQAMCCAQGPREADNTLDEWVRLLCRLVFSRVVEIHLALSPSPFENKQIWYNAARVGLTVSTEESLGAARDLLKRAMTHQPQRNGVASGVIAMCAALLLRAIHVEHVVEQLRGADHYMSQLLKSLEVVKRHARDMFSICNAARSIDMLAVHCPLFVVIAAAVMDKLPPVQQVEKERKEGRFREMNGRYKEVEDTKLNAVQAEFAQPLPMNFNNNNNSSLNGGGAGGGGAAPEQMIDWTHHMLRNAGVPLQVSCSFEDDGDEEEASRRDALSNSGAVPQGGEKFGMGHIPPGILGGVSPAADGGTSSVNPPVPVDTFAKIFIAARLATEHVGRVTSGSAEAVWTNAATAFASCREDSACATPFAEMATIARLRMGDAPVNGAQTLQSLGATVLQDVCLALRCGHPRAFDAAVADASQELAARGLLSSVMALRTHAVMMLVRKYLNHNSDSVDARRLDVEDFFSRYRSQLPATLLDTEMQLIVPLILGQRLKARLENATLAMAPEPLAFDQ